jgi:ribosomal protein L37AE/L43A
MSDDFSIKDEMLYKLNVNEYSIKRPNKYKKKQYCPECGHELKTKLTNGFLYCKTCHKRISGKIYDINTPIKDIKL